MDSVLTQLLSFSNVMMALAVFALVLMQRKLVESIAKFAFKKDLSQVGLWRELFLPLLPVLTGALVMLIPGLPVPAMFAASLGGRAVFGVGLGLLSGLVYRMTKQVFLKRVGKEETSS